MARSSCGHRRPPRCLSWPSCRTSAPGGIYHCGVPSWGRLGLHPAMGVSLRAGVGGGVIQPFSSIGDSQQSSTGFLCALATLTMSSAWRWSGTMTPPSVVCSLCSLFWEHHLSLRSGFDPLPTATTWGPLFIAVISLLLCRLWSSPSSLPL